MLFVIYLQDYVEHGSTAGPSNRSYSIDAAWADTTCRHVDDSLKRSVIRWVHGQTEVGDGVTDLFPFIELGSADELVNDTVPVACRFHGTGLCVSAIHDGDLLSIELILLHQPVDFLEHHSCLFVLVVRLADGDRFSLIVLGPQVLLEAFVVVCDHAGCGFKDKLGGAVTLIQSDGDGVRIHGLEVGQVPDIGVPPGVDRLVGVAHDAYVLVLGGQQSGQRELDGVCILEFVHQNVPISVLILLQNVRVVLEQVMCAQKEIVEIDGVGGHQLLRIPRVHTCNDLLKVALGDL